MQKEGPLEKVPKIFGCIGVKGLWVVMFGAIFQYRIALISSNFVILVSFLLTRAFQSVDLDAVLLRGNLKAALCRAV